MKFTTEYFCINNKFLVRNLVSRNLKIRYRKSFFGMLWTLLIPAGMAIMYYLIFHHVLKVQIENYLLVIIGCIVPWTFFSNSLGTGTEMLVSNYTLLNKVKLPPQSLIFSDASTHMLNLILGIPVIIATKLLMGSDFTFKIFQFIPLMVALFLIAYALSIIFGIVYVYFRDLKYVITLLTQFWFYATPVMYQVDMVPEKFRFLMHLNPVGFLFTGIQKSLVSNSWMSIQEVTSILIWMSFLTLIAFIALKKVRYKIVEIL